MTTIYLTTIKQRLSNNYINLSFSSSAHTNQKEKNTKGCNYTAAVELTNSSMHFKLAKKCLLMNEFYKF